jgi:hypothetical protein
MDVAEQASFVRLPEGRSRCQLRLPPDVVEERGRDQQVGAKPWM